MHKMVIGPYMSRASMKNWVSCEIDGGEFVTPKNRLATYMDTEIQK